MACCCGNVHLSGGRPQASLLEVSQQAVVDPLLELPLEFFPPPPGDRQPG